MKPTYNMDPSNSLYGANKNDGSGNLFGRDPFGKSDLDYLFGENFFKSTKRSKSRFNLQPNTPPVNRGINPGVTDKSSVFSSNVNRNVVSPQRNSMVQEPVKQHNIPPPAMNRQVLHPPTMYRNVSSNHEYLTPQYDELERDRASLIVTLKREWSSQVDEENKNMIYKWIQEYQSITREEFAKRSREAGETKPLYWSIFNTYYCDRLKNLQKEMGVLSAKLVYERGLRNEVIAENLKKTEAMGKEHSRLSEELKKVRKELALSKKEISTLERALEDEKKNYQNDLMTARNRKRKMIASFRNLLIEKEESHMRKLKEKKEGTLKQLQDWAEKYCKDRENLPLRLQNFRDVLVKIAEVEKKNNTVFSSRLTGIVEQHEQRVLNSVKDKIFDKLMKDFEVEKEDVDVENDQ